MKLNRFGPILLVLFLLTSNMFFARAQETELDSLKALLKNCQEDTIKLKILDNMTDIAPDGEWELYSAQMGLLAQKLMNSANKALRKQGKKYYSVSLNNKAFTALEKGDYSSALNIFEHCLKINQEINDKKNMALTFGNIGVIYDRQGDNVEALKNYKMALALEKITNGRKEMVATLNNIAGLQRKLNQADSADQSQLQALNIAEKLNYKSSVVTTLLSGAGSSSLGKGDSESAMLYYTKGLKMSEEIGDNIGKSNNNSGMAEVYFSRNELDKSKEYGLKALDISIKANNPKTLIHAATLLKKIYEKKGDFENTYKMYQLVISNRDSLDRKDNQKAVIRHQFKYEYDLKEATTKAEQEKKDAIALKELQRQKLVRNGFMGGFAVVLLFAGVFFSQRNKIKKGKKLSDELLLNILPAEVAEELKAKGSADAQLIDEVTVLFTDFKGFTAMSEKLTPKELVRDIHECFSAFDHIIAKYNIEKIKTIGDAYMAAGGLPIPNKTHAIDVINAALEIAQFIEEGKARKMVMNEPYFEIRIGVHTGPVVAGIVGVKKFAYDIWGDTVNTASRMESSGEVGKVNISGTTYELVKDKFNCVHRGKITAKGKGEIDMYFVS